MLLPQKLIISWCNSNRRHYEDKGYQFTKNWDQFEVDVKDLAKGSHAEVLVKCDYCDKKYPMVFKDYVTKVENCSVQKCACKTHTPQKQKEIRAKKKEEIGLTPNDNGYYGIRENRINEFKQYIEKNKESIGSWKYNKEINRFKVLFAYYNETLDEIINELGLKYEDLFKYKRDNYYDDFSNLEFEIEKLIKKIGRFPFKRELATDLNIGSNSLKKHGGYWEVREKMNFKAKDALKDDRGYYNRSSYEFIVAQFLIHNYVDYKRDNMLLKVKIT
ncbi:hypothetical protein NDK43_02560 [Neobacillus pocheonensis]|uniref:Uncharacterized protein n=1 Tax=Neobacillus pocheonensis TaxID=363869 RepID=A0ABT0W5W1_9BACI|nr:hypothetical protein [Neobacillus pocheonensis]